MTTAFSDEKVAIGSIRRRVDDFLRKEDMTEQSLVDAVEGLIGRVKRRRSATIDAVTGLHCAAALKQRLTEACERLESRNEEFCLIKLDLSSFTEINERHGHATGDRVLRRVATVLPDALRTDDFAARFRDDEFCIVAPGTDDHTGRQLAKRLRECILRLDFDYGEGRFRIDCDIGVAHFRDHLPDSVESVIESAYSAMRKARSAGNGNPEVLHNHRSAPRTDE